jgi:hypothetical protein
VRLTITMVAVALALALGACGGDSKNASSGKGDKAAPADAPRKLEPVSVGKDSTGAPLYPEDLAAADGHLWATVGGDVLPLDPATGKLAVAKPPSKGLLGEGTIEDIAAGDAGLWAFVDHDGRGVLYEVDPKTGERGKPIPIPLDVGGSEVAQSKVIAVGAGRVWAAIGETSKLLILDPDSGKSTVVKVDGLIRDIAAGDDAAWVVTSAKGALHDTPGKLVRVAPGGKQETDKTFADPTDVTVHGDLVWPLEAGAVERFTKYGAEERSFDLGELDTSGVASIAAGDTGVWVVSFGDAKLVRIDVAKDELDGAPLATPNEEPNDLVVTNGFAWLTSVNAPLYRVRE